MATPGSSRSSSEPTWVFVDTNVFIQNGFYRNTRTFQSLQALVQAGTLRLLMPAVTRREILSKLAESVETAKAAVVRAQKEASVLRLATDHPLKAIFMDHDWKRIAKQIRSEMEEFLDGIDVHDVASDPSDALQVFDDFFEVRPPFGAGKKRKEFVDAMAVRGLVRHATDAKLDVWVVSQDGDLKSACGEHACLKYADSLPQVIEAVFEASPLDAERVRTLLQVHKDELNRTLEESFANRGFYWINDNVDESEVEEVYDVRPVEWEWSVIDSEADRIVIAGDAELEFTASIVYPDPDSSIWDSEDKRMIFFGSVRARVQASETVSVEFEVSLDDLKNGLLRVLQFNVAIGDVWFSEDEVLEIETKDYSV